jgi:Rieske Fe-S protein
LRDEGELDDYRIHLCRDAGGLFAVDARCTHRGCTVSFQNGGFRCPCHASTFDADGQATGGPAPGPLRRYVVCVDAGGIVRIDLESEPPAGTRG